jgi:hypothetical protein
MDILSIIEDIFGIENTEESAEETETEVEVNAEIKEPIKEKISETELLSETEAEQEQEQEIELFNIMLPFFNILYKIDKLLFSDLSLPLYSSIESIDFFSSCDEHDEESKKEETELKGELKGEEILFKGIMKRTESPDLDFELIQGPDVPDVPDVYELEQKKEKIE